MMTQLQEGSYKRIFPVELATDEIVFPMIPWDQR